MTPTARMERARELFGEALDLPASERHAFLERACAGDDRLRYEVLELLEVDAREQQASPNPGEGVEWLARQVFGAVEQSEPVPQRLGEFRVVRQIGQGGMGIVYEAVQDRLHRRVAIKVLHPGLLGPGAVRRFHRESRAMAALAHPHIVRLLEAGTDGPASSARPYLVMEYVDGPSLRQWCQNNLPTVEERLQMLVDLCEAVQHAHQKGIVHRDLKPDNILVVDANKLTETSGTKVRSGPQPKILDFGVSRLLEDDADDPVVTRVGQVVGTAPYLSPEQAEGSASRVDTRSDVYALGVIAFELLTERLPFEVHGLDTSAAIRVVLNSTPARLRTINPVLHPDLQTVVHKAMHRDPAQRYNSAAEFGADIRRYLAHEPVLAREPSWTYVTSRFVRRHRALTGVIVTASVLIAASVVAMAFAWADARRTREAAVRQRYLSAMSAASVALASGDLSTARRELEATPPEHRGWEYEHLATRLDQSRECIRAAFKAPFVAVSVPGFGLTLANTYDVARLPENGSAPEPLDPRLRLWVAAHASVFPGSMPWTEGVVYCAPDAKSPLKALRLDKWPAWADVVHEACMSADGSTLALRAGDQVRDNLLVQRLDRVDGFGVELRIEHQVARIALSGDGRQVALAEGGENPRPACVRVLDSSTGKELYHTPPLPRAVASLVLRDGGRDMVLALQNGALQRWDLGSSPPQMIAEAPIVQDALRNLCLSADGTRLVGASRDGVVKLFNSETLELIADLMGHESEIFGAAFDAASGKIVSTGTDSTIRMWDPARPVSRPLVLRGHTKLVHPIAISETRHQVLTGSWDSSIAAYSLETGERLATTPVNSYVQQLVLSPDERWIAMREYQQPARLLDATTLQVVYEYKAESRGDKIPMFDKDSTRFTIALEPWNNRVWVGDVQSGAVKEIPFAEMSHFVGPLISHAAGLVAVSEARRGEFCTALYALTDGRERFVRPCRRIALESMAFTADGTAFAITGENDAIDLLDARNFHTIGTFRGHTREVLAIVFSPDSTRLFSADLTGVIRIWDARTFEEVGQLRGHESHIRRLAISADGKHLVSGSHDTTARVWSIP